MNPLLVSHMNLDCRASIILDAILRDYISAWQEQPHANVIGYTWNDLRSFVRDVTSIQVFQDIQCGIEILYDMDFLIILSVDMRPQAEKPVYLNVDHPELKAILEANEASYTFRGDK